MRDKNPNANQQISAVTNLVGLMSIKVYFDKTDKNLPTTLISYGALPGKTQMTKRFDGEKCHIKFLLWACSNVTEYKKDARHDQTLLNIFTMGGSGKEFPLLMRGLVQMAGSDVRFYGDVNRIKFLWFDNIKFYDLQLYFETATLDKLSLTWCKGLKRDVNTANAKDAPESVRKVMFIYELASKFLRELQSIRFCDGTKKYDFNVHSHTTAGSMALSVFQFLYLKPETEIRGTLEADILAKEKLSVKSPSLYINNLAKEPVFDYQRNIYRLFKMNRMMNHLQADQSVPIMFKDFADFNFDYDSHRGQFTVVDHRYQKDLKLKLDKSDREFKFGHTSLYKVDYLVFRREDEHNVGYIWQMHKTQKSDEELERGNDVQEGPGNRAYELRNQYMWGVELIYGL